jgi:hypothetical protein
MVTPREGNMYFPYIGHVKDGKIMFEEYTLEENVTFL